MFVRKTMTSLLPMMYAMMNTGRRTQTMDVVVFVAALMALFGGFGILRLSAATESYLLLFLSFGLMVWGLLTLFTGSGRHWGS